MPRLLGMHFCFFCFIVFELATGCRTADEGEFIWQSCLAWLREPLLQTAASGGTIRIHNSYAGYQQQH